MSHTGLGRLVFIILNGGRTVPKADFVEWRKRTVTAAKSLPYRSNEIADRTARGIEDTLEPALTQTQRQSARAKAEQLTRELLALCNKALRLSIALGSSKAMFRVVVPGFGTEVPEESEMELVAMDGKTPCDRPKVAFAIFGGLEKRTLMPRGNEEIVGLEKAQVVGFPDDS